MVKYSSTQLDKVFHALADPTRRRIVQEVSRGPKSMSRLANRFDISLPLASKHLTVLEEAGLVSTSKEGRVRTCRFEPEHMKLAMEWMAKYTEFWEGAMDRLADQLEGEWEESIGSND